MSQNKNVVRVNTWTADIFNSVEEDLKQVLKEVIMENPGWGWEQLSIQDVYACAINLLPPIYTKKGRQPHYKLTIDEIRNALHTAMLRVEANPIHVVVD